MADTRLTPGAWLAICWGFSYLALAGVIGMELDWGRHIFPHLPEPKSIAAAHTDYTIQPEFTLSTLAHGFAETTGRPIFFPARRPPPPVPAQAKPIMQKNQFVLLGALITGKKSIAMLREVASGKSIRVEQGNMIGGITVSHVYPEKVVLTQDGETEELLLKIQQSTTKPFAAPKPPSTPKPVAPANAVTNAMMSGHPRETPKSAAPAGVDENAQTLINRRRAARGLPPI